MAEGIRVTVEAIGYARAVEVLRDDERYERWRMTTGARRPSFDIWHAPSRHHLADYLEGVGPGSADG